MANTCKCGMVWMDGGNCNVEEWVMNDLYEHLIGMPLWLHSAFGDLKINDVLKVGSPQIQLIKYLVRTTLDKCPHHVYDYYDKYNIKDYIPLIKSALSSTKKFA